MGKILLIEDDWSIRELYSRVLKKAGYEISSAEDGNQGLKLAKETRPDLILLDLMMPRMNGVDTLKALRNDPPIANLPVMILTNLGQESLIEETKKLGVVDYILKIEIGPYELVEKINHYFTAQSAEKKEPAQKTNSEPAV